MKTRARCGSGLTSTPVIDKSVMRDSLRSCRNTSTSASRTDSPTLEVLRVLRIEGARIAGCSALGIRVSLMTGLQGQSNRNSDERRQPECDEAVDENGDDGHIRRHAQPAVNRRHGHLGHSDATGEEAGPAKQNRDTIAGDERREMDVLPRGEGDEVQRG